MGEVDNRRRPDAEEHRDRDAQLDGELCATTRVHVLTHYLGAIRQGSG